MKAYKFRSTNNFDHLIDILINGRLYCANHRDLNDVFEADIRVGKDIGRELEVIDKMKQFDKLVKSYRVCSLTKTFDNHQLWAYYANGHTGLAIEIELPEDSNSIFDIDYSDDFLFFSDFIDDYEKKENVIKPLIRKRKPWQHEQELRIITPDTYFDIKNMITAVIVGCRMNLTTQIALDIICSKIGIPLYRSVIADSEIYKIGFQKNYENIISNE